MHYELRLYPVDSVGSASRSASSAGTELEASLDSPTRVIVFDALSSLAAAMFADHGNLVGLAYAVENGGSARPVSTAELANALEGGTAAPPPDSGTADPDTVGEGAHRRVRDS
jgi:hypothetical protein